jgi:hypothetical protein
MAVPGLAERIPLSGIGLRKSANASLFIDSNLAIFFTNPSRGLSQ